MDSDFPRPYGWVLPKGESDTAYPPSSSNLYNLTYPMGNPTLIREIEEKISRETRKEKLVAW